MRIAIYINSIENINNSQGVKDDFSMIREFLSPHLPQAEFLRFAPPEGEYPDAISAIDAHVFTGSTAMVTDKDPWIKQLSNYIQSLDAARAKILGICFGHQIIASALGGVVEDRPPTIGVKTVEIMSNEPFMHPYSPALHFYAGNFQQVTNAPKTMRRVAMAKGNPNAMLAKDDHILSLQFHPEFNLMFMEHYVDLCLSKKSIDIHTHQEAKIELQHKTDGEIFGAWVAKFLKSSA